MVFDFDDTLVESEAIKDEIFKKIFSRFPESYASALEFHRQNGSRPRAEKFAWLAAREFPSDEDRQKKCVEVCLKEFREKTRQQVAAAPEVRGVSALLSTLCGRIPLYVASVNPQEELGFQIRSRGWERCFGAYFGNPPLPKAEALRQVAWREKIKFQEVLLVGDSQGDSEAATEVGSLFWMRKRGEQRGDWMDGEDLASKLKACLSPQFS